MNYPPYFWAPIIALLIGPTIVTWLRRNNYIRQPTGKYGWGLTRDDFKMRIIRVILVCLALTIVFCLIYLWAVQTA